MFDWLFNKKKAVDLNAEVSFNDNSEYVPIKKLGKYQINENHMFFEELEELLYETDDRFADEYNMYDNNVCPNCGVVLDKKVENLKQCPECHKKIVTRTNYKTKKKLVIAENRIKEYEQLENRRKDLNFFDKLLWNVSKEEFNNFKECASPLLYDKCRGFFYGKQMECASKGNVRGWADSLISLADLEVYKYGNNDIALELYADASYMNLSEDIKFRPEAKTNDLFGLGMVQYIRISKKMDYDENKIIENYSNYIKKRFESQKKFFSLEPEKAVTVFLNILKKEDEF